MTGVVIDGKKHLLRMHEVATLGAVFTARPHVCRWNLERGFLSGFLQTAECQCGGILSGKNTIANYRWKLLDNGTGSVGKW